MLRNICGMITYDQRQPAATYLPTAGFASRVASMSDASPVG
jgi:hypothetical protein